MIITNNEQLPACRIAPLRTGGYVLVEHQRTRYNPVSYSIQPLMADRRTISGTGQAINKTEAKFYSQSWDDATDYRVG